MDLSMAECYTLMDALTDARLRVGAIHERRHGNQECVTLGSCALEAMPSILHLGLS